MCVDCFSYAIFTHILPKRGKHAPKQLSLSWTKAKTGPVTHTRTHTHVMSTQLQKLLTAPTPQATPQICEGMVVTQTLTQKSCTGWTRATPRGIWLPSRPPEPLHLLCRAQDPVLPDFALQTRRMTAGSVDAGLLVADTLVGLTPWPQHRPTGGAKVLHLPVGAAAWGRGGPAQTPGC